MSEEFDMLLVCKIENEFGYPEKFIVDSLRSKAKNITATTFDRLIEQSGLT